LNAESPPPAGSRSPGRLTLPSLAYASFVYGTPGILTGLLLIDIGVTFGVPVGIMGQIRTASSFVAMGSALLVGVASMRFSHKILLQAGLASLLASAIGCTFAQSYLMMLVFYPLTGLGIAMIAPMALTLIAQYFPLEKRARAVSWFVTGGSLSYVIGSQMIVFLTKFGDWRLAYIGFVIPAIVIGLMLSQIGLPSPTRDSGEESRSVREGYRAIITRRSALACLLATALRLGSFQMILVYGTSFFREQFGVTRGFSSILMTAVALAYSTGSFTVGRLIERHGRRRLTILTTLLSGLSTILMTLSPNFTVALLMNVFAGWFSGMANSAAQSLNLEQVPEFRGIMMSLNASSGNLGAALGGGIGGFALLAYGYWVSGTVLGAIGILAALIYMIMTVDPSAQARETPAEDS
jgi:DHA1 family multidrug resistance protein-like MFS transporter